MIEGIVFLIASVEFLKTGYIGVVPLVSGLWLFRRVRESLSVKKISAAQFEKNLWWTHQGFRLAAGVLIVAGIVMLSIGLRGTHH